MKVKLFLIIFSFFTAINLSGQAGMIVYAGPSLAFSSDKVVTRSGEAHYGFVAGANARLNSDNLFFLFSGEYGEFDFISNDKVSIIGGDDLSYIKAKVGLGLDLFRVTSKFSVYTKLQGSLLMVQKTNDDWLKDPRFVNAGYNTEINDGIAGIASCAGVKLGIFHIELEYDHGLFNIIKDQKTTKINFINLTTGVRF